MMRCKFSHTLKCPAHAKICVHSLAHCITVHSAAGWPHDHAGPFGGQRGLDPRLKADIFEVLKREPNIKPGRAR